MTRKQYLEQIIEYMQGHEGCAIMTGEEILDWYLSVKPARQEQAAQ